MNTHFDITWTSLWRIFLFGIAAFLAIIGREVLLALFLAIVISAGLDFFVNFFEKRGIPRAVSVLFLFIVAAALVLIVAYVVVPALIQDLYAIISRFDQRAANYWLGPLLNFNGASSLSLLVNRISGEILDGGVATFSTFSGAFERLALGATVIVSAFYLSLSRDGIERFIRAVFPGTHEGMAVTLYRRARKKIGIWLRTQVLLSLLVGFLTWLALFLLGVEHALVLALLTALLELVPFVGPLIAGAIAVLLALLTSPLLAVSVLIAFVVIQQVEGHVLVPLITGKSVGLHPVIVIIALLLGATADGLLGAIIAVPAAAVIQEVLEDFATRKRSPDVPLPRPSSNR